VLRKLARTVRGGAYAVSYKRDFGAYPVTKRPIQVYLEDRQHQALRRLAVDEGISLSELIRRGVDLLLAQVPMEKDSMEEMIGLDVLFRCAINADGRVGYGGILVLSVKTPISWLWQPSAPMNKVKF